MTALRATAYVLTSLASLVFLTLVIYAAIQLASLANALEGLPGFGSAEPVPAPVPADGYIGYMLTPEELSAYCPEVPDDPACALR
jgi:hypothetical protein